MTKRLMFVFGTRPEAIKMAPLVKACEAHEAFDPVVVVTAQHREMLDQVLALFQIQPNYDLNIMKPGQSLTDITCAVIRGLEGVIGEVQPDMVLVHGDTTTTFAGALAAYYQGVPVAHVEAGLRSGNMYAPFPEEGNRRLTAVLSAVHLAPTAGARHALLAEGVVEDQVYTTGNTVIDALNTTLDRPYNFPDGPVKKALARPGRKLLLTAHRRENLGEPMHRIFAALVRLLDDFPDTTLFFPMHKNPKVRAVVEEVLGGHDRVVFMEPLDYQPFVHLMNQMDLILTDSGGLQEEAPSLGKPVLVLRDTTERPEAVEAGTVRLVGTHEGPIYVAAAELLTDPAAYAAMKQAVNPYGDGAACDRILQALGHHFGLNDRPAPWA
ncbi:non-hydrolyzing UDP-N-acetylglucosamine 2-epimerase [Peptococcus simiae]|uniref:non-hydrolyzing UDP-N-acetylglucosamine 2-epimerase n=1 Tax=Peptococcus simiae TaxID=1643805 RepID=UPI00398023CE